MSDHHRHRKITFAFLAAFIVAAIFAIGIAFADGTPNLQSSASATNPLFGKSSNVNVNASLGSGQVPGYNLSFRVVLPEGISYAGGAPEAPQTVNNAPNPGETTLIFSNISDLVANASQGLSFNVNHDTLLYQVGDSYQIDYQAFVNSDPRLLPKFDSQGQAIPSSYTGSAATSTTSTISAIRVTKNESSREGEILRGVHDHQTVYTLTVENNNVNPAENVVLEDYLPDELEFLGCQGTADHTTDAPTNPGSAEEYPGSGPIIVGNVSDCQNPASVETVNLTAGNPQGLPAGVYTHVAWQLNDLNPSESVIYRYRAAVPLARNTLDWTGSIPTPSSGDQAANLDNNSGAEITDETGFTNYSFVAADYLGNPVSSSDSLNRSAEDALVYKDRSSGNLSQGAVTTWTLTFKTSEYRYGENFTVTDTLPNGFCPLGPVNYTTGNSPDDSECDPTGNDPSVPYSNVVENADGSFDITWDPSASAKLTHSTVNDTFTITFPTKTRANYQDNFEPSTPILSGDSLTNRVDVTGDSYSRCVAPSSADCQPMGTRIWSNGNQPETIEDASSASQSAQPISILKEVATSGTNCLTATYANNPGSPPVYAPGDKVCWRLTINFPSNVDTGTNPVYDFLPPNTTYIAGSQAETANNNTSNVFDDSDAANRVLSWSIDSGFVPVGAKQFQVVFATTVTPETGIMQPVDISANLMKVSTANTPGQAYPVRDLADFETKIPSVSLDKGIRQVNGGPINVPPAAAATINGGDQVVFQIDVPVIDGDVSNVEVWDFLPTGWTCASVNSISDSGTCASGKITWMIPTISDGSTKSLTYELTVPSTVAPAENYINHAGVRNYETATNTGGQFVYTPENNIDPANLTPPNVPAADDTATLTTPNVTVAKTRTTSITQLPGNNTADQATIGEFINYTVTATLPKGTTFATNPRLTDTPNSATTQPVTSYSATLNGSPLPGGWTVNAVANAVTVAGPNGYTVSTSADDVLVLNIQTRVADVAGNTRSGQRSNSATFSWTAGSARSVNSNSVSTRIVEPQISQTKTNNISGVAQAGQIVTYTLTTRNSNSTYVSAANDTLIWDNVPLGITPVDGSDNPLADGAVVPGTFGATWDQTTRRISAAGQTINPNTSVVWSYRVKVDNPSVGGSIKTNTANVTTTSINGVDPNERTSTSATNTGYLANSNSTFQVGAATITKTASKTNATIGESIRYTSDITIPAGIDLYNLTAVDTLPAYLDYDGMVSASCISGCPADPAPTVQEYNTISNGDGTLTVAWDLGHVAPGTGARVVRIVYDTHVRATQRVSGTPVAVGNTFNNRIRIQSNFTDKYTFNPANLPAQNTYDYVSPEVTRSATVVEPNVGIDKQVQVNSGSFTGGPANAQPGSNFTYQLTVTNTGNSPAYDLTIEDEPANGLVNVQLASGAVYNTKAWTPGDHQMEWTIPGPVAPGGSVTLTYTADLDVSANLTNGQQINNTAAIPSYFGVSEADRNLHPTWTFKEYNGGSDTVQVNLRFPSLAISKTTGAPGFPDTAPANIGQPFTWRIVIQNNATLAQALDTLVTDTLPPDWNFVAGSSTIVGATSVTPSVNPQPGGDILSWDFSGQTIAPGASVTISFQATPSLAAYAHPGSNINSASVTTKDVTGASGNGSGDYAAGPDTATANLLIPNLEIEKTPDDGSLAAGSDMNWTLIVRNTGTGAASNVSVSDLLPAGMFYVAGTASASPATGFSETTVLPANGDGSTTTSIDWSIASIAAGGQVTITLPVHSLSNIATGTNLVNSATVSSPQQPTDNTDQGNVITAVSADLEALKSYAPNPPTAGENFTYTIGVKNNGPSDASGVVVTDQLPSQVTFVSADVPCTENAGNVECVVGSLPAGQERNFTVTVHLNSQATSVSNTAVVSGTSPDPDPDNNSKEVTFDSEAEADVAILKTADPDQIHNEENTTFRLEITNPAGPSSARGLVISDAIPAEFDFVSVDNPNCSFAAGTVTCNFSELAVGDSIVVNIVVQANTPGIVTNTATVNTTGSDDPDPDNNTSSDSVEILPAADLEIVKTGQATVNVNQEFDYQLQVTNLGPDSASNVQVTDSLPGQLDYVSDDAGCSITGQDLTCDLGAMASGASQTITVTVRAKLSAAGSSFTNTAKVSASEFDPDPDNNTSSFDTAINPAADLEILKTAPAQADINEQITYTFQVTNNGPSPATGVTVTDSLPSGVTYVSNDSGCNISGQDLECLIGNLAVDGTSTINVQVQVNSNVSASTITNTADVAGSQFDPDPNNNQDSTQTEIGLAADLEIVKTGPLTADVQDNFIYTLEITNRGPDTASDLVVDDTLPAGLTYISDDSGCLVVGQDIECQRASLGVGASWQINLTVVASVNTADQTLTNTASISSETFDPDPDNNTSSFDTSINPAADLAVIKTAPAQADINQNIVYTLTATNQGPSSATNVSVTDSLPAGITYVSDDAGCTVSGQDLDCFVGPLGVGASQEINVTVTVGASLANSQVDNTGVVAGSELDPDPDNNTSTVQTIINPAADLGIIKSAPAQANVTDLIVYTFDLVNNGPDTADNVIVEDTLPSGVEYVSDDSGCAIADQDLTCSLNQIPSGETRQINVQVRVLVSAADSDVSNTAVVSSDTFDPDPDNNTSTAQTNVAPAADLRIVKLAEPENIDQSTTGEFVLQITNLGPDPAINTVVTDQIPSGLEYISNESGCNYNSATTTVDCSLGNIQPGDVQIVRITVRGVQQGIWTNTADVSSDTFDQDLNNNSDSADLIVAPAADLAITKTAPTNASANQEITYSFTVENLGPELATNVVVNDPLPAGLEFISSSDCSSISVCNLGSIAAGEQKQFSIIAKTTPVLADSILTNTATVASNEYDPDPDNNTSSVETQIAALADLGVEKSGPAVVEPGSRINWSLRVYNNGPNSAENVVLIDQIPATLSQVEVNNPNCDLTVECQLGTIPADSEIIVNVSALVPEDAEIGSKVVNSVVVSTSTDDFNPDNEQSESETEVTPTAAMIRISKTASQQQVNVGDLIQYQISVFNQGHIAAKNIKVTDLIPGKTKFVSVSSNCKYNAKTRQVSCYQASLAGKATATFRVNVKAVKSGKITNTAVQNSSNAQLINISASASVQAKLVPTVLAINKRSLNSSVTAGGRARYKIQIKNTTNNPALNVSVCDHLPRKTIVINSGGGKFTNGKVCWNVDYLGGKKTKTFSIVLKVDRFASVDKITNKAVVKATNTKHKRSAKARVVVVGTAQAQRGGGVTG